MSLAYEHMVRSEKTLALVILESRPGPRLVYFRAREPAATAPFGPILLMSSSGSPAPFPLPLGPCGGAAQPAAASVACGQVWYPPVAPGDHHSRHATGPGAWDRRVPVVSDAICTLAMDHLPKG